MAKKRKVTILVIVIILLVAIVFAVTRFLGGGAAGIDNKPEKKVIGNSVANSEKEVREWADELMGK